MKKTIKNIVLHYSKWILISVIIGVGSGLASGIFLASLEQATHIRESHPWLLYLLPFGGLIIGLLYHNLGRKVEGGNNLIIDEFHAPKATIPFRMAPLVLLGTIITHLFGGSAGREGTAVQMGGAIADQFTHFFKTTPEERRRLLMIGMSGGFSSVFGVPFAGTLFGLEVLAIGKLQLWALFECAVSAFVANFVTLSLGIQHAKYLHPSLDFPFTPKVIFYTVLSGIIFGLAAKLFAFSADTISKFSKKILPFLPLRIFLGGTFISLSFYFFPLLTRYAGLGVPIIEDSLRSQLYQYDWIFKLLLTALTLGMGFKGGEVTPLLFIGAALGNTLSLYFPIPLAVLAAIGLVGVFSGAANTPIACTLMAMELFGAPIGVLAAIASFSSYAISGHHGIYSSQRIHIPKSKYASKTIDLLTFFCKKASIKK